MAVGSRAAIAGGLVAAIALPGATVPAHGPASLTGVAVHSKQDAAVPAVPPLPVTVPAPIAPEQTGILGLTPAPTDNVGIGHLRPTNLTFAPGPDPSPLGAEWLQGIALPIYPTPDSPHWGWLINGWLVPNEGEPLAIGRDAAFSMVQTEQQVYTFPVLEVRPDGWFQFQYTPAGAAWAHTSHLGLGAVSLTVEPWETSMQSATRLQFRRPGLSQPMRLAPTGSAPLQALVGPNSIIQPLDLEGDWLRVRVTQPVQGCTPLPGSSTSEGWVRWRSDADMPLVWFSATDC
ncbi:hypothetical protein [Leptolyngbya sp. KIOST-1]|uniref:hypothetical protein n=1 Tax=Leptolyngbya sp. KIOST-1 TaxID=1229172 RepID=UPI00056BA1CF|nr:hypothetical protein [Leptolyngbya sp. KIOST-1]